MVPTSFMRGTLCTTVLPGARSAADASFKAAFFAPETSISPQSRAPPSTRKHSMSAPPWCAFPYGPSGRVPVLCTTQVTNRLHSGNVSVTVGGCSALAFPVPSRHPHQVLPDMLAAFGLLPPVLVFASEFGDLP